MRRLKLVQFAEQSEPTRSPLDRLEKLEVVNAATLSIQMRYIRNRIVDDYFPEQVAEMFDLETRVSAPEQLRFSERVEAEVTASR